MPIARQPYRPSPDEVAMAETSRIRILLIDDDDGFRGSLASRLVDEDFQVAECASGRDALELLGVDQAFDLIFLDWRMPGLSGIEVLQQIKAAEIEIPVVCLTEVTTERNEASALDGGAADFLDKSRSAAVLARRVRLLVGSRRVAQPEPPEVLKLADLDIHSRVNRAYWHGRLVPLTTTEFRVVQLLATRAGEDVSYRAIYDVVHGRGFIAGDGSEGYRTNVRSMIKRIRQKFRELDEGFEAIENYPGFGYRWCRVERRPATADDVEAVNGRVLGKLSRLPFVRSVASWRRRLDREQPSGEAAESDGREPPARAPDGAAPDFGRFADLGLAAATARSQPE